MKWNMNEQTEINKSDTADNQSNESQSSIMDEDGETCEERQSPNLSMDEVRSLLDEFEEILHTK